MTTIQIVAQMLILLNGPSMRTSRRPVASRWERWMSKLIKVDTRASKNRNNVRTNDMSIVSDEAARTCIKARRIK